MLRPCPRDSRRRGLPGSGCFWLLALLQSAPTALLSIAFATTAGQILRAGRFAGQQIQRLSERGRVRRDLVKTGDDAQGGKRGNAQRGSPLRLCWFTLPIGYAHLSPVTLLHLLPLPRLFLVGSMLSGGLTTALRYVRPLSAFASKCFKCIIQNAAFKGEDAQKWPFCRYTKYKQLHVRRSCCVAAVSRPLVSGHDHAAGAKEHRPHGLPSALR